MNEQQFDMITARRFKRLTGETLDACRAVVVEGLTAYAAEKRHNRPLNTISRLSNRIENEYHYCIGVHDAQETYTKQ